MESFVVPLAEKIFLPAEEFMTVVRKILDSPDVGYETRSPQLATDRVALRMYLTSGRSYKKKIAARGMGHDRVRDVYLNLPLPHFIWICELSHADLYTRAGEVLGEVVWDATCNAYELDGWIAIHYPEILLVDVGAPANLPQNIMTYQLEGSTPYPLYRSNLTELEETSDGTNL